MKSSNLPNRLIMIRQETMLNVADNSGAKQVLCIGIPGNACRKYAAAGDTITVSIKKEITRAVILRTKKETSRPDGTTIKFSDNAVAIIDKNSEPRFTRILGPIDRQVREHHPKIANLAKEIY